MSARRCGHFQHCACCRCQPRPASRAHEPARRRRRQLHADHAGHRPGRWPARRARLFDQANGSDQSAQRHAAISGECNAAQTTAADACTAINSARTDGAADGFVLKVRNVMKCATPCSGDTTNSLARYEGVQTTLWSNPWF